MQFEVDYNKVGQRIRTARLTRNLTQAELASMVGCSNNHLSHVETGQTKVSLSMLLQISYALEKDLDYFLLDTPFVKKEKMIDLGISEKLRQCDSLTLLTVSKILDVLLEQQNLKENHL